MPKGSRSKAKPAQKPVPDVERETVINMKGSKGYAAWLEDRHRETHIPKVQIVRVALAEWAERNGRPAPPEI
jgi:hypothetical protein